MPPEDKVSMCFCLAEHVRQGSTLATHEQAFKECTEILGHENIYGLKYMANERFCLFYSNTVFC